MVLLDSRVVIGAATKGRSSSRGLNRVIRQLAAFCFVGGLALHLIFIPTEHNPGDHPSRGGPTTWPKELLTKRRKNKTKLDHAGQLGTRLAELNANIARLRECGHWDYDDSDEQDLMYDSDASSTLLSGINSADGKSPQSRA